MQVCEASGKRCYLSKADARRAIRTAHARFRIYLCLDCKRWHATAHEKAGRGEGR